ncbi:Bug family tripartite tricarboxylate transporter substrate binding protein [Candidimonas nitroreducens]|uniref:Receptor n=1 Tax=Candidimonas nitroreducens TaxID=683354 RepID=A0A225MCV3_9BURK|nr:tripartite tricarboxylate transporter substrate binding protein [Candidimonas nitroreducens]OWT56789.1 hypothetical protein CEY11_18020 [Candidimonas nitroreducens]
MQLNTKALRFASTCLAAVCCSLAANAQAQYPEKPISIIVPFGAGSGTDTLARTLAKELTVKFGQSVVVEDKPGAGGIVGAASAARSAPDGYTLLLATSGPMAANASLYSNLPYDPVKSFQPVALIGRQPMLVIGGKAAKTKTFGEIIAQAKAQPDKINFGASSTTARVLVELMKKSSGIQVETVLYKNVGSLMTDMIGGRISYAFENAGASIPQIDSGRISLIAVTAKHRAPFAEQIPATGEYGFDERGLLTWYAMFAPKNTPADVVAKLNTAVNAALKTPAVQSLAKQVGLQIATESPAELGKYQISEIQNWKHMVAITGVKID